MPYGTNFHNRRADVHQFAMIPRAEIPRSSFRMQSQHKTTVQAGALIPVYLQEVLPGDSFNVQMTAFVRMATPLFPVMDNITLETFFFFVPNRLVWTHWVNFMGEQANPADSISFSVPQLVSTVGGYARNTIFDYFGLPCTGQVAGGNTYSHSALPLRAYNLIWNQWFRDENLQNSLVVQVDDGPDTIANYNIAGAAKRHDYFTSCLPWTQKGGVAISVPLAGTATVKANAVDLLSGVQNPANWLISTGSAPATNLATGFNSSHQLAVGTAATTTAAVAGLYPSNLFADLSTATGATINQLRQSFQIQKLLERDARGGTRYTEIVRSHFGVTSPDARLQRPEYLGGGKQPVTLAPVPQTAQTGLTGGSTPLGTLAAVGTAVSHGNGFRQSFTEHGHIIGLMLFRADQVYQQGLRKLWSRSTRYDFFFPVFSALGEQPVLNKEIFLDGSVNDALTFGFVERWAEYRYHPSFVTGFFNSRAATPLDAWHLGQNFASLPALNSAYIVEPLGGILQRCLAAGAAAANQQFLCDLFFDQRLARPMPMYSVPGLIDHF